YAGTINLTVTATSTDGTSTSSTTSNLTVDVEGVADTPSLNAANASGTEDHSIPLDIAAGLSDVSESLGVTIAGVPEGGHLSAGTDLGDGAWLLTPDDLPGLTFTPPADYAGTVNLTVTATSSDGGSISSNTATLAIVIDAVADAPTDLSVVIQSASGSDTTFYPDEAGIIRVQASYPDIDGSESHEARLSVPDGMQVTDAAGGLWIPGDDGTGGYIELSDQIGADGKLDVSIGVRATEIVEVPWSGDFELTATAADGQSAITTAAEGAMDVALPPGMGTQGDDTMLGASGAENFDGRGGNDTLSYENSDAGVTVNLGTGAASGGHAQGDTVANFENVTGSSFADRLTGDANANILSGGAGADMLDGGSGDDTLIGGAGADSIVGGAGADTVSYAGSAVGVTVNLGTTNAQTSAGDASGDRLSGIENVEGSAFADSLTGTTGANILSGGAGDDTLIGAAGADTLIGGEGSDTASYAASTANLSVDLQNGTTGGDAAGDVLQSIENLLGGSGNDALYGDAGANRIDGGSGNDTIEGGAGADTLIGGSGTDTLSYTRADTGVSVNLATGANSEGDTISGFENATGSAYADTLTGDANANRLEGGAGDDTLVGGLGNDTLVGGAGIDTADYSSTTSAVTVNLATGAASGGAGTDSLSGIENVIGTAYADTLTGDANANRLDGGAGNDTISGGASNDTLIGGDGIDTLSFVADTAGVNVDLAAGVATGSATGTDSFSGFETVIGGSGADTLRGDAGANRLDGGSGNDTLIGGAGADTLIGNAGNDTADYSASADAVQVNLATATAQVSTGDAAGDVLSGIETVIGSAQSDTLTGDGNANRLD
ncbi:MAG: hypothetical protein C6Y20_21570, partial [Tagaea sp. CACIAM 22H2]|nr:hypothetical protein [Tagaea sp. CACIAM 22H2]